MNRPPEFDKQKALDAAVETIWKNGYNAASLSNLTNAMGLSKSSFYNSFGNKQQVLLDSIDAYTTAQARATERLFAAKGFRGGLNAMFEAIISNNNDGKGCLLVNCASEVALHDARAATYVREGFAAMGRIFAAEARQAMASGELSPHTDAEALATSVIAFISGIRILAKTGVDRTALRATVQRTLDCLAG